MERSEHGHPAFPGRNRILFVIAMMAFGTVGLFVRRIPLPSAEIALYRAVIAMGTLSLILSISGRFRVLRAMGPGLWKYALSGAVMAGNWILLFEAYAHTSIALATLSYYAAPSLVVIASVFLLKEKLSLRQLLFFALSTLGLVLMMGVSGGNRSDLTGVLLGGCSAVLYAGVVMINKVSGDCDGIARTFVQFAGAITVLVPLIAFGEGFHLSALDGSAWSSLLILGAVHTGLCYCLYFVSLTRLKGQQVAILSYLDPLVAVLLSVLLLGERIGSWQLLGGATMLLFAMLNEAVGRRGKARVPRRTRRREG